MGSTSQEKEDSNLAELSDIRFSPPLYEQRYQEVARIARECQPKKVVDIGCGELSVIRLLKFHENIHELIGMDVDVAAINERKYLIKPLAAYYIRPLPHPFTITLLHGSITERDSRLLNCDLVVCVEVIEHMYPADLAEATRVIFGYMQPKKAVFTTPNSEFNVLFPGLEKFRHYDHKFEWTRQEFQDWGDAVCSKYGYQVEYSGLGVGPPGTEHLGFCTQTAIFDRSFAGVEGERKEVQEEDPVTPYVEIAKEAYPFKLPCEHQDEEILHEAQYRLKQLLDDARWGLDPERGVFDDASDDGDDHVRQWVTRSLIATGYGEESSDGNTVEGRSCNPEGNGCNGEKEVEQGDVGVGDSKLSTTDLELVKEIGAEEGQESKESNRKVQCEFHSGTEAIRSSRLTEICKDLQSDVNSCIDATRGHYKQSSSHSRTTQEKKDFSISRHKDSELSQGDSSNVAIDNSSCALGRIECCDMVMSSKEESPGTTGEIILPNDQQVCQQNPSSTSPVLPDILNALGALRVDGAIQSTEDIVCANDLTGTLRSEDIVFDIDQCIRLLRNESESFRPGVCDVEEGVAFCSQWEKGFPREERDYGAEEVRVTIPLERLRSFPTMQKMCPSVRKLREVLVASDIFRFTEDGSAIICDLYEDDTKSELWVANSCDEEEEDDVRKDHEVGDDMEWLAGVTQVVEEEESWD